MFYFLHFGQSTRIGYSNLANFQVRITTIKITSYVKIYSSLTIAVNFQLKRHVLIKGDPGIRTFVYTLSQNFTRV
jgi:hypothetical protein